MDLIRRSQLGVYFAGKSATILSLSLIGILSSIFPLAEATWINLSLIPLPVLCGVGLVCFLISMKIPAIKYEEKSEK